MANQNFNIYSLIKYWAYVLSVASILPFIWIVRLLLGFSLCYLRFVLWHIHLLTSRLVCHLYSIRMERDDRLIAVKQYMKVLVFLSDVHGDASNFQRSSWGILFKLNISPKFSSWDDCTLERLLYIWLRSFTFSKIVVFLGFSNFFQMSLTFFPYFKFFW